MAHARAAWARSIGYVEAHGRRRHRGRTIEGEGLTRAFRAGTQDVGFCGSVGQEQSGATVVAAGAAGVIKTALPCASSVCRASPNSSSHPAVPFDGSPFTVNAAPKTGTRRPACRGGPGSARSAGRDNATGDGGGAAARADGGRRGPNCRCCGTHAGGARRAVTRLADHSTRTRLVWPTWPGPGGRTQKPSRTGRRSRRRRCRTR